MQTYTLARLGSTLYYWISGAENAPLVVLTHGAALNHRMFDPQITALTEAGYCVLTWDMRGHGQSKPMGTPFSVQTAADDLLAILDQVGAETAALIGHSFGGFVTQEFTFRHPERVKAVGIIGCTDMAARPSGMMAFMAKLMPHMLPMMSLESFRKRTVENVSVKQDVMREAYEATGSLTKDEYITVIMAGVDCLAADAGYGTGYTIPKPFLLTHGELDKANNGIFPRSAPLWARKQPFCTYKVIPQAGHTANQDNPEVFNAILLDFLTKQVELR